MREGFLIDFCKRPSQAPNEQLRSHGVGGGARSTSGLATPAANEPPRCIVDLGVEPVAAARSVEESEPKLSRISLCRIAGDVAMIFAT